MARPDLAEEDTPGQTRNLLSMIGDPIGKVLNVALKPVGYFIGAIGNPAGQALLDVQKQAKKECAYTNEDNGKTDKELPGGERVGGKGQTGGNPLGL